MMMIVERRTKRKKGKGKTGRKKRKQSDYQDDEAIGSSALDVALNDYAEMTDDEKRAIEDRYFSSMKLNIDIKARADEESGAEEESVCVVIGIEDVIRVGREEGACDLTLIDSHISARHARD